MTSCEYLSSNPSILMTAQFNGWVLGPWTTPIISTDLVHSIKKLVLVTNKYLQAIPIFDVKARAYLSVESHSA